MYAKPVRPDRPTLAAGAFVQGDQPVSVRPGNEDRHVGRCGRAARAGGDGGRAVADRRDQPLGVHGGDGLVAARPGHDHSGNGLAVLVEDRGCQLRRPTGRREIHQRWRNRDARRLRWRWRLGGLRWRLKGWRWRLGWLYRRLCGRLGLGRTALATGRPDSQRDRERNNATVRQTEVNLSTKKTHALHAPAFWPNTTTPTNRPALTPTFDPFDPVWD